MLLLSKMKLRSVKLYSFLKDLIVEIPEAVSAKKLMRGLLVMLSILDASR